jgi:hypothetical protein
MYDSKSNIKFNYEYRDAGNYRVSGDEVFTNPDSLSLLEIESKIKDALISSEFFDPSDWKVKRLKHQDWIPELDHTWNNFDSVDYCDESPTNSFSITEFLKLISTIPKY